MRGSLGWEHGLQDESYKLSFSSMRGHQVLGPEGRYEGEQQLPKHSNLRDSGKAVQEQYYPDAA